MKKLFTILISLFLISSLISCQKQDKLSDIYPFINNINSSNLKGVRVITGYIGVAPEYAISTNDYSEELEDLEYNLKFLKESTIKEKSNNLVGGSYIEVTYYLNDGTTYSIRLNNKTIYQDDIEYKIESNYYPKIDK